MYIDYLIVSSFQARVSAFYLENILSIIISQLLTHILSFERIFYYLVGKITFKINTSSSISMFKVPLYLSTIILIDCIPKP